MIGMTYKTVCREGGCCEVGVEESSGIEVIISCTTHWPSMRLD